MMTTRRDKSSSQVSAKVLGNERSFGGLQPPIGAKTSQLGTANVAASKNNFFHYSPIELRSQNADSVNFVHLQSDLHQLIT